MTRADPSLSDRPEEEEYESRLLRGAQGQEEEGGEAEAEQGGSDTASEGECPPVRCSKTLPRWGRGAGLGCLGSLWVQLPGAGAHRCQPG